jgi:hypothetical protein
MTRRKPRPIFCEGKLIATDDNIENEILEVVRVGVSR